MDRNFADNKYIRKDIRLKTAENKKYRAKRVGKNGHIKNGRNNKYNYSLLDDYNVISDDILSYYDDYAELPIEHINLQHIIIDEYVVL